MNPGLQANGSIFWASRKGRPRTGLGLDRSRLATNGWWREPFIVEAQDNVVALKAWFDEGRRSVDLSNPRVANISWRRAQMEDWRRSSPLLTSNGAHHGSSGSARVPTRILSVRTGHTCRPCTCQAAAAD